MNYAQIRETDISDGPGIRVALYVSGCEFHCPECFNGEAQNHKYGQPYTTETELTILNLLRQSHIAGLSLLGGDPLWQSVESLEILMSLCECAHAYGKNVWLWTGFTWEEIFPKKLNPNNITQLFRQRLVRFCDVIVDGRFEVDKKDLSLPWRGSSNQRVIDIKKSIGQGKVVLYET